MRVKQNRETDTTFLFYVVYSFVGNVCKSYFVPVDLKVNKKVDTIMVVQNAKYIDIFKTRNFCERRTLE